MTTIDEIKARLAGRTLREWESQAFRRDVEWLLAEVERLTFARDTISEERDVQRETADHFRAEVERLRAVLPPPIVRREIIDWVKMWRDEAAPVIQWLDRLDAYRAHEAASERFRARAGDEPGGVMVSDETKEGGEHG